MCGMPAILENDMARFKELLEFGQVLGHSGLDPACRQPLQKCRPSRVELPFIYDAGGGPFLLKPESHLEVRRRLGQGLHSYLLVRHEFDNAKGLFIRLTGLMICC